jgi:hypothetical protein
MVLGDGLQRLDDLHGLLIAQLPGAFKDVTPFRLQGVAEVCFCEEGAAHQQQGTGLVGLGAFAWVRVQQLAQVHTGLPGHAQGGAQLVPATGGFQDVLQQQGQATARQDA